MPVSQTWIFVAIFAGAISVGVAAWLYRWVHRQDAGSEEAQEVASWIREGATAYLRRLYLALTLVAVGLGVFIAVVFSFDIPDILRIFRIGNINYLESVVIVTDICDFIIYRDHRPSMLVLKQ